MQALAFYFGRLECARAVEPRQRVMIADEGSGVGALTRGSHGRIQ
jgi:hypothetical protein